MRNLTVLLACLWLIIGATTTIAGPIADSLAFQGRLTDLSDNPVPDGPRDLIISLWTDSIGGTMLHSEIVVVSVSKGLYSTCIGCGSSSFFDIFTDQPMFLETQLAGQSPMTPRTRLRNTPRALVSSRVRGDVATAPGMMVVGDSTNGGFARVQAGLQSAGSALSQGASLITQDCDDTDASASFGHSQGSNVGIVNVFANVDSTGLTIAQSNPNWQSSFSAKGKEIRKTITINLRQKGGSSSREAAISADSGSSSMLLDCDDDGDGISESSVSSTCDASSSSQVQEKKGLNAVNVKLARTISSPPGGPVAVDALDMDSDDDGIMDVTSSDSIDASGARRRLIVQNIGSSGQDGVDVQMAAQKKGGIVKITATQNSQSLRCSSSADSASATMNVDSDHDGDGTPECRAEATVSDKFAQVRGFKVELSGRSSSFGSVCDSSGASSSLISDDDGDTVPESEISHSVTPTTSSVAIKTKGTGADANRVVSQSDTSGAGTEILAGAKNIGLYVSSVGSCRLTMTDGSLGTVDTTIIIDGALKRFGIGVSQPDYPMHHSSGAHLTVGGVWTNASDENLKENFQQVNGADLLEKIDQLPISEWNYKSESDGVKHIGPTAQDFQKVFGVGENDNTISTIDPSGIALAAIKELNRQNLQLQNESERISKENERLQKELSELKARVDKLISDK